MADRTILISNPSLKIPLCFSNFESLRQWEFEIFGNKERRIFGSSVSLWHLLNHDPKPCGNCAFLQNFHIMKLGEITVFYAVFGDNFY